MVQSTSLLANEFWIHRNGFHHGGDTLLVWVRERHAGWSIAPHSRAAIRQSSSVERSFGTNIFTILDAIATFTYQALLSCNISRLTWKGSGMIEKMWKFSCSSISSNFYQLQSFSPVGWRKLNVSGIGSSARAKNLPCFGNSEIESLRQIGVFQILLRVILACSALSIQATNHSTEAIKVLLPNMKFPIPGFPSFVHNFDGILSSWLRLKELLWISVTWRNFGCATR